MFRFLDPTKPASGAESLLRAITYSKRGNTVRWVCRDKLGKTPEAGRNWAQGTVQVPASLKMMDINKS